ncbi:MAG: hypothetical protein ACOZFS_11540 [Thermodesulfobacteriota bacterium]
MNKSRRRQQKVGFIDKIADHIISMVLSFLFTIGLIGGSGYILFQSPAEENAVDRQTQELANQATSIRQFNDMLNVFASGWFADQTNFQPEGVFIQELSRNTTAQALDPTLKQEVLNWTSESLMRLTSEKGHIEGFVFSNDFERAFQQHYLKIYSIRISMTEQLDELALNWEQKRPQSREERLELIQALRLDQIGNLQGIFSKISQLQDRTRIELQQAEQTKKDLTSQIRIIWLKNLLAIIGIVIGVSLVMLVGRAVIMKNAQK